MRDTVFDGCQGHRIIEQYRFGGGFMKTIEISAFGIGNLKLDEQPKPSPADDEVLVKIDAVSLNYVDLLVIKGLLNPHLQFPYIPGCDGAMKVRFTVTSLVMCFLM